MWDISEKEIREKLRRKETRICNDCQVDINGCSKCPWYELTRQIYEEVGMSYRKKKS